MFGWIQSALSGILGGLAKLANIILLLLPKSPFTILDNTPIKEYLPAINYFIPIQQMLAIGELWLTCIAVYYLYQIVLRWAKAIS